MTASPSIPRRVRRLSLVLFGFVVVPAVVGGASLGYGLKFDLPDVRALEDYTPPLNTRVLARDGSMVASFGEQRRILIASKDIPEDFERALVSVEDSRFYRHNGIDLRGIARAAWHDLTTLSFEQGASTLTQQLARSLFLSPDKTARRKVQEMLLAVEIERNYTKQEILRLYCNQVYIGHGFYGIESASRFYFGKPARDLDLPQAALLAGIIQRPEGLSPFRNPGRALKRRNHVLTRMADEGYITLAKAEGAQGAPLVLAPKRESTEVAPYFVEEVRRWLQPKFGEEGVYQSGLEVRTTLDPRLQILADRAMDVGLRQLDKRQGWRGVTARVRTGQSSASFESPAWRGGVRVGEVTDGVVLEASRGQAKVRVGPFTGWLGAGGIAWTGRPDPSRFLRPGDLVRVRVVALRSSELVEIGLEQEPQVEAALVALDPATGAVRALVGGFDFKRSEFDRAIQARRQAGSAFKPLVYAAALTGGFTPAQRIQDEPTVFVDPVLFKPYQPDNYGGKYFGELTLREALERSANIATVKLLDQVGYDPVIELARKLGISTELQPYPSMALGAFEVSLLEMTSAYGTFANQGVRVEPHLVEEVRGSDGVSLERAKPEVRDAVSPQIAYIMNRLLEGVVTDGTGKAAASVGRPMAGKTGTTDDCTDAWFIGYAPDLVVGVWVGFDKKTSLGPRETGAQAALPIWLAFMETAYDGVPVEDFAQPPGVSLVAIDRDTGLKANEQAGCVNVISEAFVEGSEPTGYCSAGEHALRRFPYTFQRYPLSEQDELQIPSEELDRLLASEPEVRLVDGGRRVEVSSPEGSFSLVVRRLPGGGPDPLPPLLRDKIDPTAWIGHDGRPARIVLLQH